MLEQDSENIIHNKQKRKKQDIENIIKFLQIHVYTLQMYVYV